MAHLGSCDKKKEKNEQIQNEYVSDPGSIKDNIKDLSTTNWSIIRFVGLRNSKRLNLI